MIDLSATPFFLRGSGYAEGTLFPWTMSDFSLMDAIECGIKKPLRAGGRQYPRRGDAEVPQPLGAHPHLHAEEGPGQSQKPRPAQSAMELQTALEALYGHYKKTYDLWEAAGISVPPCFIVVCNTSTSKLVYDYIAGSTATTRMGQPPWRMAAWNSSATSTSTATSSADPAPC